MGQKVHPTGFRTGITEPWKSRWYASKREFKDLLLEDVRVRRFLKTKYRAAAIAFSQRDISAPPSRPASWTFTPFAPASIVASIARLSVRRKAARLESWSAMSSAMS